MDIYSELKCKIIDQLKILQEEGILSQECSLELISLERPKNDNFGELSTNAAIILARFSKLESIHLAEHIANKLNNLEGVAEATIAHPGFVNLRLDPQLWQNVIGTILNDPSQFGRADLGKGQAINLEFVSANPTGPLHIGHTRGAVFGDTLARLLEFTGYKVTREYYVNDGGAQVDTLARSAFRAYEKEHGRNANEAMEKSPGDYYSGSYIEELGIKLKNKFGSELLGKQEDQWLEKVKDLSISHLLQIIKNELEQLGVHFDNFVHEKQLYNDQRVEESLARLEKMGMIYEGSLPPPKGKKLDDWEPRQQTLFKSTQFGDDVDRPIKKADGSWTYFAPDIAYHYDKISRGYSTLINILGHDHGGYVKRLKAVVKALSEGKVDYTVKLIQLVNVIEGGEKAKMSKRAGNFVMQSEALNAVGADVTRFVMLMRKNDMALDFDFQKVQEQSKDNPVFYVQYAHARICSLLNRASEEGKKPDDIALSKADFELLAAPEHIRFIRRLAEWPRVIKLASKHTEPHRIAFYLVDLASEFHSFWAQGQDKINLRILQPNNYSHTMAGLAMARATGIIIALGLGILGVKPIIKM